MASTNVREIVGDVRFALATHLRDQYPRPDGTNGFSHTAEAYLVQGLSGVDLHDLQADYYIAPGDGAGPIVVEVGELSDKKWQAAMANDGKPVRVLHINLDRFMRLDHPRHTKFEGDMLQVLREVYTEA